MPVLTRSLVVNGFHAPVADELAPLLERAPSRVTVRDGADASRDALLAEDLDGYTHIHVAAHGKSFADSRVPAMLRLPGPEGTGQSLLDAETIGGWNLDAELVVLAACESAAGEVYAGEQPLGLERAFLAAGARRVISTLWRVEDGAARFFSNAFYEALLLHGNVEGAYQDAVQALRAQRRWRDPHFWAPFTLSVRSLADAG